MVALDAAGLRSITSVPTPSYDRAAAGIGIVHFGFGSFHRSHLAMYVDRLMESGEALDWGICGVGVLPQDAAMRDVMAAQDRLYTLVLRHPDGTLEPRVVGSVLDYLFAPEEPDAVLARLVDPRVRIVSLTVTEGGYLKDPATGQFLATHPSVVHDVEHPAAPSTAFGFIVEGLRRRRAAGIAPFTVLSCDNLPGNGPVARQAVTELARLGDPELARWIASSVAFPGCMVDRITPVTTDEDRAALRERFGVDDRWPVPAEPFVQWLVEDEFPAGRPPFEDAGVQLVDEVAPYELMKLRMLNASHQALAYLGAPLGCTLVDEVLRDDDVRELLLAHMAREVVPTLGPVPGIDLDDYASTVVERFSNPMMVDTLGRLATDGSNRMPTFVLPTIRDNRAAGRATPLGALVVAAWAELWASIARGEPPACGTPYDVDAEALVAAAGSDRPEAFLEQRALFGDLGDDAEFRREVVGSRRLLAEQGVHVAIRAALAAPAGG